MRYLFFFILCGCSNFNSNEELQKQKQSQKEAEQLLIEGLKRETILQEKFHVIAFTDDHCVSHSWPKYLTKFATINGHNFMILKEDRFRVKVDNNDAETLKHMIVSYGNVGNGPGFKCAKLMLKELEND